MIRRRGFCLYRDVLFLFSSRLFRLVAQTEHHAVSLQRLCLCMRIDSSEAMHSSGVPSVCTAKKSRSRLKQMEGRPPSMQLDLHDVLLVAFCARETACKKLSVFLLSSRGRFYSISHTEVNRRRKNTSTYQWLHSIQKKQDRKRRKPAATSSSLLLHSLDTQTDRQRHEERERMYVEMAHLRSSCLCLSLLFVSFLPLLWSSGESSFSLPLCYCSCLLDKTRLATNALLPS